MKHLTGKELTRAVERAREELGNPVNLENQTMWQRYNVEVSLEFPLGELTNPSIAGFVWAWKMQDRIHTTKISGSDRFNAHGLEGKVIIRTTLSTALLAAGELSVDRVAIRS